MLDTPVREFVPPPEAPVFEPTREEFDDPLDFIEKIRPIAEKTGICKIKPPSDWQPPFAVDVDNFRFTPRVQKLNELEAKTRTKLNFLDNVAKFWELQGCSIRIPNVERKHLDLFNLRQAVIQEGGYELVCKERKWARVAHRLGYPAGKGVGSTLRTHYEKILYPYDVFKAGATVDPLELDFQSNDIIQRSKKHDSKGKREAVKKEVKKESGEESKAGEAVEVKEELQDGEASNSPRKEEALSRRSKRILKEIGVPVGLDLEPRPDGNISSDHKEPNVDFSKNPELKKLQFFGAGPKMAIPSSSIKDEPEEEVGASTTCPTKKSRMKTRRKNRNVTYVDHYMCHTCGRGDQEESMLLCDGCDDAFHLFCLIPPMSEVPKGDWRCPKCVAKECKKPLDPYGFEQAKKEYTLQSFGEMADQFKQDYFNMPVHMVPYSVAEKEFWRLVDTIDEDVTIEYGADIHSKDCGSGFPTRATADLFPEDEEYITSWWNLNNLPVHNKSVLQHINADISGMKVPWCYVGMCFSSFCWHIEDHWSYSINYLHWGEPKTWYGVPGSAAERLEECMKQNAPELFEQAPDLLHQLTTIMNPNILMDYGVPIVRTNQCAGEFVITFPRSYHAGFNQGYNFAEAVNFCPADWLPIGRACIDHYRAMRRQCVFSHQELVCKMAADPDSLDLTLAAATHADMLAMVEVEKRLRKKLLDRGTTEAEREAFELLPDDERQCEYCKTTCFLSAVTCPCCPSRLVCIEHAEMLCNCHPSRHCLRYRYTLDELPAMLHRLKVRAEAFDNWAFKVRNALEGGGEPKLDLSDLKGLIIEAEEKKFPTSPLLQMLKSAVSEAEKCANVANQLVTKKVRTRHRQSGDSKYTARLSLEELEAFNQQVDSLPCRITEAALVSQLLDKVANFQAEAHQALADETPDSAKLQKLVEFGVNLDVDLPEIPKLKQVLQQAKWLDSVRDTMLDQGEVTLETMRKLIESGVSLAPHPACEKAMAELQELLTVSERWEEKARVCIQARPRHTMSTLESIINETKNIPAYLPNVSALKDALRKAREWTSRVESIQTAEQYPYLEALEGMVNKGRPIPVRLDQLPQVESQVAAAKSWRERTARTFLKKNSSYNLVEILSPRTDIGVYGGARKKKKNKEPVVEKDKENNNGESLPEHRDPAAIVAMFKQMEEREVEMMRELRTRNMEKANQEGDEARYCTCRRGRTGFMLQCELCKDLFHSTCVPLPKSAQIKSKNSQAHLVQAARDMKFLCPHCLRSRRPRLETILSLLVSLQKLPVRLPEGEALQCLTERAMAWQDRARQALATEELASALARLSVLSQRIVEQAAKEKTEKIISAEIMKAAAKPELQGKLVTPLLGSVLDVVSSSGDGENSIHEPAPLSSEEGLSMDETGDGELFSVDFPSMSSGMSSEHAYSTASKGGQTTTVTPKKQQRKSPLVPRRESPVLELSDLARAQLEELMMEGDLLEVSLDETQHIWRILQACQPKHDNTFPLETENREESLEPFQPKLTIPAKWDSLDKEKKIKKKKRPKPMEGGEQVREEVFTPDKPKKKKIKLLKDKDTKEKVKPKEGEKPSEGSEKKKKRLIKKKSDGEPGGEIKRKKQKKTEPGMMQSNPPQDDDDDDDCAAIKCLKPTGEEVNWVQCDRCEQWFHMLCVGLAEEDVSEHEDYHCFRCRQARGTTDMQVTNGLSPMVMRRSSLDSEGSTDVIVTDSIGTNPDATDLPNNQPTKCEGSAGAESARDQGEKPLVSLETSRLSHVAATSQADMAGEQLDNSENDSLEIVDIDDSESKGEHTEDTAAQPNADQEVKTADSHSQSEGTLAKQKMAVSLKNSDGQLAEMQQSSEEDVSLVSISDSVTEPHANVVVERTAAVSVDSLTSLSDKESVVL